MKKKKVEIQLLKDGDELISAVSNGDILTLAVKHQDTTYEIFLLHQGEEGLLKFSKDAQILVTKTEGDPLVKTTPITDGESEKDSLRVYTL